MMRKIIILFLSIVIFNSCSNNDKSNYDYQFLKIDSVEVPTSFSYGGIDQIKVKFTLPDKCYSFDRLYYEYQETTRIVAIVALIDLNNICAQETEQLEYSFSVKATQREDYIFKFWKGKDSDGNNLYEEVIVPVE